MIARRASKPAAFKFLSLEAGFRRTPITATILALLAALSLSGCTGCIDQLDVRNCVERCAPEHDDIVLQWTAERAKDWPQVDALLGAVPADGHLHAPWMDTESQAAFWRAMGVDPDSDEKQVFIVADDATHRIRILSCA